MVLSVNLILKTSNSYWFAPGTRVHLYVPGVTGGRGNVFAMALPRVTLLNAREIPE